MGPRPLIFDGAELRLQIKQSEGTDAGVAGGIALIVKEVRAGCTARPASGS